MKTFDLSLDFSDLMDDAEKSETNKKKMLDKVKQIVENAILSSQEDVQLPTSTGPKSFIRGTTQRKLDRILDALEDCEDGKLIMPDKRGVIFQEMWSNRLALPAAGGNRKLMQRIDRRICPDAYKNKEDDDDDGEGTADDDKA